mmetsp:Transcript_27274/g.63334  ORF Transcript_27274/g.63334 Transcript_27274/m.63334 type:complete len:110 (+) Transcript_27274:310-639(+)
MVVIVEAAPRSPMAIAVITHHSPLVLFRREITRSAKRHPECLLCLLPRIHAPTPRQSNKRAVNAWNGSHLRRCHSVVPSVRCPLQAATAGSRVAFVITHETIPKVTAAR